MYGVKKLNIVKIDRLTQYLSIISSSHGFDINHGFLSFVRKHIDSLRIPLPKRADELREYALRLTLEYPSNSGINYLIVPMLVRHVTKHEDMQLCGCFIIQTEKAGGLAAKAIDEISDALANRLTEFDRAKRYEVLNKFSHTVSELKADNLSQERILNIAYEHIREIMYGNNLYVALYDKVHDSISFPLMYVGGEARLQASREIDHKKLGKTEEIILTGKPLRHRTKAESIAWYKEENHEEFMGNPLASWVGVPIYSSDGVKGVIAAYHPEFDAIYSKRDVFFLTEIASQVSSLFRILELSNTIRNNTELQCLNKRLESAQAEIAEREKDLHESFNARDISHQLGNILPNIKFILQEIADEIRSSIKKSSFDNLYFSLEKLDYIKKFIEKSIGNISTEDQNTPEILSISRLLNEIIEEQLVVYDLYELALKPEVINTKERQLMINGVKRDLIICFSIIIENACEAIKNAQKSNKDKKYYIKAQITSDNDYLYIDITDNGSPIDEMILDKLFKYGASTKTDKKGGYGLWRAKLIIRKMNGDISLHENDVDRKTFRVCIPLERKPLSALIVEDEGTWKDMIIESLRDESITFSSAKNYEEATSFIETANILPDIFFLDISLDPMNSRNVDGLKLVNYIRKISSDARIVIFTAYPERTSAYKEKAVILSKTDKKLQSKESLKRVLEEKQIII
jgi:signal transduction histidine kinase